MLFTGGGGLLWWLADVAFLNRMVEGYNERQATRKRAGLPPAEFLFLDVGADVVVPVASGASPALVPLLAG